MRLQNKVCLITGGAKGIGAATAELFCEEGAIVEVADMDEQASKKIEKEIFDNGGEIRSTIVDITDSEAVSNWAKDVIKRHGKIDVLFNNAGISAVGEVHKIEESLWDRVIDVNIKGTYLVSKAVLPVMMKQEYGSIINMSSCVAEIGLSRRAAYAATKGAVLAMTKSMQVDYASYNIRVNALMPGTIFTPFVEDYLNISYDDPEKAIEGLKERQLGSELGTPKDVAHAALYLASDDSTYVMGSGLKVDGGVTAGKNN